MNPLMKVRRNRKTESEQKRLKEDKSRTSSEREKAKAKRKARHRSRRMGRSILFASNFCFWPYETSRSKIKGGCAVKAPALTKCGAPTWRLMHAREMQA
jgi:hypothetical protein